MLTVKKTNSFEAISDSWHTLWQKLPVKYPFFTWQWQQSWAEVMIKELPLIYCIYEDGNLIGLVPLRREGSSYYWLAGEEVSDYLDAIALEDDKPKVWQAVIDEILKENGREIILRNLPEKSLTRISLERIAKEKNIRFHQEIEDVVPFIKLPATFDKYMMQLTRKDRHELRRKMRRFEGEGGSCNIIKSGKDTLTEDCRNFFTLFKKNGENKRKFLTSGMEEYFLRATAAMQSLGMLDFTSLIFKNTVIAQTISLYDETAVYLYNEVVNPDYYYLSPGLMINKCLIEEAINNKQKIYDFMQGNERYKYELGAKDGYVYKIIINF